VRRLLILLVLVACAPATMQEQVDLLEQACSTCDMPTFVTLDLDSFAYLYTTTEAVCLKENNRLTCGACRCDVIPMNVTVYDRTVCSFSPTEEKLDLSCA